MMNEIIKNAQPFLETMQTASSEEVKQWDTEALQRAVEWAKYFEMVHKKLLKSPKNMQQLNRRLHLIGHLPGAAVSQSVITFDSLSQSVRMLLQALLQNPHLSSDLYSEVIKLYTILGSDMTSTAGSASTSQRRSGDVDSQKNKLFLQDVSRFAKAKATRMRLLEMRAKLTQSLKEELNMEGKSVQQVAMETDASLLRYHLMHHLVDSQSPQKTKDYLHDHLLYVASLPNGLEAIETILGLPGAEDDKESAAVRQCKQFVSQWIMENRAQYGHGGMDPG